MKEETRVLVYSIGYYYGVFATYRKDFIEELTVIGAMNNYDFDRYLQRRMRTYSEITYVISCNGSKYDNRLPSFRVFEGGDELALKSRYCSLINMFLCMLERRGLINPPDVELIIETSSKCLLGDGGDQILS